MALEYQQRHLLYCSGLIWAHRGRRARSLLLLGFLDSSSVTMVDVRSNSLCLKEVRKSCWSCLIHGARFQSSSLTIESEVPVLLHCQQGRCVSLHSRIILTPQAISPLLVRSSAAGKLLPPVPNVPLPSQTTSQHYVEMSTKMRTFKK